MAIHFRCPHCGRETEVAEQYAGQTGPCAGCGKPVTVPGPAPVAAAAPQRSSATPIVIAVLAGVLVVALVCGGILLALLLPAVQAAREAARRAQCVNNLRQINLALLNYESANGCFPPAYIPDENGKPKHSWRVLVLPYLEQQLLYDQYDMDEPWDSPNNLALASQMPPVFRCPSDPSADSSTTSYVMIVGPGCISDGSSVSRVQDIQDGASNTILIVEAAGEGVRWSEPRDLDATQISFEVNDRTGGGIRSGHPRVANAGFVDGSVRGLSSDTDPDVVAALTTIAGGEQVSPIDFP